MIQCRLRELIAEKARLDGQRITYRDITLATGIYNSTLSRLANNKFDRIDRDILNRLCSYFNCQPGDIFVFVSGTQNRAGL